MKKGLGGHLYIKCQNADCDEGGIKAVIWTDVFQASIMFAGIFSVLIKGTVDIGGVSKTWQIAKDNGRLNFFNFDPDPTVRHTFWNLFIGSLLRGVGFVFTQSTVQRISSTPTVNDARKVILLTAPAHMCSIFLASIEGVIAYSYYHSKGCDPLKSKQIFNMNQVVPFLVMDIFRGLHGMPGLFLASLFSAALSTLSSGLSSLSALLWTDVIKPHVRPMSEFKATVIAKLAVVLFGILSLAIAFLVSIIGGTLNQIAGTIISSFAGPLSGLFLLGSYCHFANAKGAFISTVVSTALTVWIATGQYLTRAARRTVKLPPAPVDGCFSYNETMTYINSNMTSYYQAITTEDTAYTSTMIPPAEGINKLYTISYLWLAPIGILTVLILGSVISLLTGPIKGKDANPIYLVSFVDEFMCYLPSSVRRFLRCGVDFNRQKKFREDGEKVEVFISETEKYGMTVDVNEEVLGDKLTTTFNGGLDPDETERFQNHEENGNLLVRRTEISAADEENTTHQQS